MGRTPTPPVFFWGGGERASNAAMVDREWLVALGLFESIVRCVISRIMRVGLLSARPVTIDAWVVPPDHMLAVCTMPDGNCDYTTR